MYPSIMTSTTGERLKHEKSFCYRLIVRIKEVGKVGSFVEIFLIADMASDDLLIVVRR